MAMAETLNMETYGKGMHKIRLCETCGKPLPRDKIRYCNNKCRYPNPRRRYVGLSDKVNVGIRTLKDQNVKKISLTEFMQRFSIRDRSAAIQHLSKLVDRGEVKINLPSKGVAHEKT
jgi:ribosomal protein S26